jgi:hypothetical protein
MEKELTVTPIEEQKQADSVPTNREILDKVIQDTKLTGLIQLATRLKIQPHLLNAVYNGRLDMSKGLAHGINALYPQISVKWLLSGASKIKAADSSADTEALSKPTGKRKYTKRKIKILQPIVREIKPAKPTVEEKIIKKEVVQKPVKAVNAIQPIEPIVEKPVVTRKKTFKLPVKPTVANRQPQSSSNLNALLSDQETLIANMEKLVDIHLNLVETIISMVEK